MNTSQMLVKLRFVAGLMLIAGLCQMSSCAQAEAKPHWKSAQYGNTSCNSGYVQPVSYSSLGVPGNGAYNRFLPSTGYNGFYPNTYLNSYSGSYPSNLSIGQRISNFFGNNGNVNLRQDRLSAMIQSGVSSGRLTPQEADRLQKQYQQIADLEAKYRNSGNTLTTSERERLNNRLNQLATHIQRQLYDRQIR